MAGVFNVWNAYNQYQFECEVVNTIAAYTYTSATIRQANASSGMQVSWVCGDATEFTEASYKDFWTNSGGTITTMVIGLALDATNASNLGDDRIPCPANGFSLTNRHQRKFKGGLGSHFVAATEQGDGSHANTFNQFGVSNTEGLTFSMWM